MQTEATIRNRILYTLAVHGIEGDLANSIWYTLSTGNDPMPEGVPEHFECLGEPLTWPTGNGRRVITVDERRSINRAIINLGGHDTLDADATASEARIAYEHIVKLLTDDSIFDKPFFHGDRMRCGHKSPTGLVCRRDAGHDPEVQHKNHRTTWHNRPHIVVSTELQQSTNPRAHAHA